jgi:hypothetical protein
MPSQPLIFLSCLAGLPEITFCFTNNPCSLVSGINLVFSQPPIYTFAIFSLFTDSTFVLVPTPVSAWHHDLTDVIICNIFCDFKPLMYASHGFPNRRTKIGDDDISPNTLPDIETIRQPGVRK